VGQRTSIVLATTMTSRALVDTVVTFTAAAHDDSSKQRCCRAEHILCYLKLTIATIFLLEFGL